MATAQAEPLPISLESIAADTVSPAELWRVIARNRELHKEVQRLQAQIRTRDRDAAKIAAENVRLRRRLAGELDLSVRSPTFEGGLGGRTSIEHYRNVNVGKFISHMNAVGDWALAKGLESARFYLRSVVLADLAAIYASAPVSKEEDERRSFLEWRLKDRAAVAALCGTEEWNERERQDFIAAVLTSGVDTSTWELVRRSAEMPAAKTGPRDDDDQD